MVGPLAALASCRDKGQGWADEGALCLSSWQVHYSTRRHDTQQNRLVTRTSTRPPPFPSSTPCPYRTGTRIITEFDCSFSSGRRSLDCRIWLSIFIKRQSRACPRPGSYHSAYTPNTPSSTTCSKRALTSVFCQSRPAAPGNPSNSTRR